MRVSGSHASFFGSTIFESVGQEPAVSEFFGAPARTQVAKASRSAAVAGSFGAGGIVSSSSLARTRSYTFFAPSRRLGLWRSANETSGIGAPNAGVAPWHLLHRRERRSVTWQGSSPALPSSPPGDVVKSTDFGP